MAYELRFVGIGAEEYLPNATISASTASTNLPASNVANSQRSVVWRSTSDASQYIDIDFGISAPEIDTICIINHNLTSGAQFYVEASDVSAGAHEILEETHDAWPAVSGWGDEPWGEFPWGSVKTGVGSVSIIYLTGGATTARYWRINIDDSSNPDNYLQIGHIKTDKYWTPTRGLYAGTSLGTVDTGTTTVNRGYAWSNPGPKLQSFGMRVQNVDRTKVLGTTLANGLMALLRNVGQTRFIVVDGISNDTTLAEREWFRLYCRMTSSPNVSFDALLNGSVTIQFQEVA